MSKAQLVITAVVLEGRSKSEVARDYDVSLLGPATGPPLPDRRHSSAARAAGVTHLPVWYDSSSPRPPAAATLLQRG